MSVFVTPTRSTYGRRESLAKSTGSFPGILRWSTSPPNRVNGQRRSPLKLPGLFPKSSKGPQHHQRKLVDDEDRRHDRCPRLPGINLKCEVAYDRTIGQRGAVGGTRIVTKNFQITTDEDYLTKRIAPITVAKKRQRGRNAIGRTFGCRGLPVNLSGLYSSRNSVFRALQRRNTGHRGSAPSSVIHVYWENGKIEYGVYHGVWPIYRKLLSNPGISVDDLIRTPLKPRHAKLN
ncbi:hypothetical protein OUZ56_015407 [Daphnia magna]|uniref:Uncharacterized protein n=1 Tax=Daphnia magna TaxID=35525 RepID=A0ABR0AMQ4_9CRUS|nr:hypothetical protein OUZ56_015407 [Daphnia magna]